MRPSIEGYLLDQVYPSSYHPEFAPASIDAFLRHRGVKPPRASREPFALLDLGCGDGVGLAVLAAAYPEGRFTGIDALPAHVARGRATAERLGLANLTFREALFGAVEARERGAFDYVTAQGVLAWVAPANRDHVLRIAGSHLRPGGVAAIGYNAMPGWRELLTFQHILRLIADAAEGDGVARFDAAFAAVEAMSAAGAGSLPPGMIEWMAKSRETYPAAYFPHEYLNRDWEPLWSSDIAAMAAAHGLQLAAPGRVERLREDFGLQKRQRESLGPIADPVTREAAADIFLNVSYRVDIFARGAPLLADGRKARLDGWWVATGAAGEVFSCRTAAGTLKFDNAAAHGIMAVLASRPATLAAIQAGSACGTEDDVLNTADALWIAGWIAPVEAPASAAPPGEVMTSDEDLRLVDARVTAHGVVPRAATGC